MRTMSPSLLYKQLSVSWNDVNGSRRYLTLHPGDKSFLPRWGQKGCPMVLRACNGLNRSHFGQGSGLSKSSSKDD